MSTRCPLILLFAEAQCAHFQQNIWGGGGGGELYEERLLSNMAFHDTEERPLSGRWGEFELTSLPLAEDPSFSPQLRRQNEFSGEHDPDPFEGQEDDEQSELSFSSAFATPTTNPHVFAHHHRETTV